MRAPLGGGRTYQCHSSPSLIYVHVSFVHCCAPGAWHTVHPPCLLGKYMSQGMQGGLGMTVSRSSQTQRQGGGKPTALRQSCHVVRSHHCFLNVLPTSTLPALFTHLNELEMKKTTKT